MLRSCVLPLTCAATLLAARVTSQDASEQAPADPNPRIEATIDELDEAWPAANARFGERVLAVVRELRDFSEEPLHPTDRERLARTFTQVLTRGELRPPADGEVYVAAMNGLSRFGAAGAELLIDLHERERFPTLPDYEPLRAALARAIGRTDTEGAARYLLEVIKTSGHDPVLIAAGRVLRRYADAGQELRKAIVEVVARRLVGFENLAWRMPAIPARVLDPVAYDAHRTLISLDGIWRDTLHDLTGAREPNGQQWWAWYQEHREEDWSRDDAADDDGDTGSAAADRRRPLRAPAGRRTARFARRPPA